MWAAANCLRKDRRGNAFESVLPNKKLLETILENCKSSQYNAFPFSELGKFGDELVYKYLDVYPTQFNNLPLGLRSDPNIISYAYSKLPNKWVMLQIGNIPNKQTKLDLVQQFPQLLPCFSDLRSDKEFVSSILDKFPFLLYHTNNSEFHNSMHRIKLFFSTTKLEHKHMINKDDMFQSLKKLNISMNDEIFSIILEEPDKWIELIGNEMIHLVGTRFELVLTAALKKKVSLFNQVEYVPFHLTQIFFEKFFFYCKEKIEEKLTNGMESRNVYLSLLRENCYLLRWQFGDQENFIQSLKEI